MQYFESLSHKLSIFKIYFNLLFFRHYNFHVQNYLFKFGLILDNLIYLTSTFFRYYLILRHTGFCQITHLPHEFLERRREDVLRMDTRPIAQVVQRAESLDRVRLLRLGQAGQRVDRTLERLQEVHLLRGLQRNANQVHHCERGLKTRAYTGYDQWHVNV